MGQTEARPGGGRRLVLGFDAGCLTCSELAKRIEERVGDKIEVRSLNDPMMDHWRKVVFGEAAPWVPTLVEVEGNTVRAWTGIRMGARLSRSLGPVATWRVMQVLGEANADLDLVDSSSVNVVSGLTRGQFLKGVGGAAVALSILCGAASFAPSVSAKQASTLSRGTIEQRRWAQRVVRSSAEFRSLTRETEHHFDFGHAKFVCDESADTAAVVVPTDLADETGVVATFFLSLQEDTVVYRRYTRKDRDKVGRFRLTAHEGNEVLKPLIVGDDYIITPEGRKISHTQVKQEVREYQRASETERLSRSRCLRCLNWQFYICSVATTLGCALLSGIAPFLCSWYTQYVNQTSSGCRASARVRCYFRMNPPPCP